MSKVSKVSKKKKIVIGITLVLLLAITAGGCYLYLTRPILSKKELVIYTGYSKTIYLYGRYDVKVWSSDNEEVAVVEDGTITARTPGVVTITADIGKKKFICEVEVREAMSPKFYQIAEEEKEWFFSQQLENGAICNRYHENGEVSINPYFSALGVWCVLQCDLTQEEEEQIKEYLSWHFDHINEEEDYNGLVGTIYDYKALVKDGKVIEEYTNEEYDSTDSYAAVFLSALWKYYEATGDRTFLVEQEEKIKLVVNAMRSTLEKSYTYSKPDYQIVYLMDNAEVYEGLVSTEQIFLEVLNNKEYAEDIQKIKKNFTEEFNTVWWRGDHYSPYLDKDYEARDEKFSWKNFYADAVSQLTPIIYNLADSKKSATIYSKFCENWNWEELDYFYGKEADFYWGMLMYGAVKMQDVQRAECYLEYYKNETELREYPLILSDCAWVILGTEKVGDYYKQIETES